MPLGDADLASGVFFSDFGVPVIFGAKSAMGNLDAPNRDAVFGGDVAVSDQEYRLEMAAVAFSPFPAVGARLVVGGQAFSVRAVNPLDDGAVVEVKLRKL